jgi:hypothetical protein
MDEVHVDVVGAESTQALYMATRPLPTASSTIGPLVMRATPM